MSTAKRSRRRPKVVSLTDRLAAGANSRPESLELAAGAEEATIITLPERPKRKPRTKSTKEQKPPTPWSDIVHQAETDLSEVQHDTGLLRHELTDIRAAIAEATQELDEAREAIAQVKKELADWERDSEELIRATPFLLRPLARKFFGRPVG